jgi:hypothetical protein
VGSWVLLISGGKRAKEIRNDEIELWTPQNRNPVDGF